MSFHLVFSERALNSCLLRKQPEDPILLIGNGVYACHQCLADTSGEHRILALAPDAEARGINASQLGSIKSIDYTEFVSMTEQHAPIVSWKD